MVVRLQTAMEKIKKYPTVYPVGREPPPDKYVANCGQEWKIKPKEDEECAHLDCAIYLAKLQRKTGYFLFMFCIIFSIFVFLLERGRDFNTALVFSGASIIGGLWYLIKVLRARKQLRELIEYGDKGTINGIKARQNFDDPKQ